MDLHQYTPFNEISSRIEKFQKKLCDGNCNSALITQHTDLFYLTGTSQNGYLFIPCDKEPVLMIRKSFQRAKKESSIKNIVELKSMKLLPEIIKKTGHTDFKNTGLELDVLPYNTCAFLMKIFNESKFIDISSIIRDIRKIKSDYEIQLLEHSCSVLDKVFEKVPEMLKVDMTEVELASLFEAQMRKRGYSGCCQLRSFDQNFFMGNLVSGKSGAIPTFFDGPVGGAGVSPANNPHGAGWKKINKNDIIYIDYTCVVNGYTADATRMFAIGKPAKDITDAHKAALMIQKEIVKAIKPQTNCADIYDKAIELAAKTGFGKHFMGSGCDQVKFIGHGVGLELDEPPVFAKNFNMKIESKMTFAIEPKFVLPDGAVGIENTYVMEDDGPKVLTHAKEEIICV